MQGTAPSPRLLRSAVWEPQARQMTIFGGFTRQVSPAVLLADDTWSLAGL